MAPLACDPTALGRAGATVLATGVSLGSVISALTTALAGTAGMAGDDPVGAALGRAYDGAAAKDWLLRRLWPFPRRPGHVNAPTPSAR